MLEEAAVAWPQDYALAMRLGDLYLQAGDLEAARRWYRTAVALSGGASAARTALARTRGAIGVEVLGAGTWISAGEWLGGVSAGGQVAYRAPRGAVVQGGYRYASLVPRSGESGSGVLPGARGGGDDRFGGSGPRSRDRPVADGLLRIFF